MEALAIVLMLLGLGLITRAIYVILRGRSAFRGDEFVTTGAGFALILLGRWLLV